MLKLDKRTGQTEHLSFRDLPSLLSAGDLLVLNETRVTALRLQGRKSTGAHVEALLLTETAPRTFEALAKPGRALRVGAEISFAQGLTARVVGADGICRTLEFEEADEFAARLRDAGEVPLPPYIRTRLSDKERYQTVYSRSGGSAAAPTAGLHFTEEVFAELKLRGVDTAKVALDVGVDTFAPLREENLNSHRMHGEVCRLSPETAEAINGCSGRIVAVGTTTVRTLESLATSAKRVSSGERETRLFIRPGFNFQVVDAILTNFHMPRTTMLVMLAAFVGREPLFAAYKEAIDERYRFLSFGDSMILI